MKKLMFMVLGFLLFNITVQAESYDFSLIPYNVTESCEFSYGIGGQECFDKVLNGELEDFRILDNKVSKNDLIMILVHMKPSTDSKLTDARIVIDANSEIISNQIDELGSDYGINNRDESVIGGLFPLNGKKSKWEISDVNYLENGRSFFLLTDTGRTTPIIKEGNLVALFYRVSENAEIGTSVEIKFDQNLTQLANNSFQKVNHLATFEDVTLTVADSYNEITSKLYTIKREENLPYIYGTLPNTTIEEYVKNFENNVNELHVFDLNDQEILDKSKYITTKMKLKLIRDGNVLDELAIVVKGDINCDGDATVADRAMLNQVLLRKVEIDEIPRKAADINHDGIVNINDHNKYILYINMEIDNLN
ncbi:MAG: hypothetical protein HFI09_04035 [Bacilli bacterium]|nr:hypothetical protein [Bacilli bacterium]